MASKKPKVGDRVLHVGHVLTIQDIGKGEAGPVANCWIEGSMEARDEARAEVKELRAIQVVCDMKDPAGKAEWDRCRARILELDGQVNSVVFKLGLRCDLLRWVPSQEMWGRLGQMLSDAQRDRFVSLVGKKPTPGDGEIAALNFLAATPEG